MGNRKNLVNSAILELFETITKDEDYATISYIVKIKKYIYYKNNNKKKIFLIN